MAASWLAAVIGTLFAVSVHGLKHKLRPFLPSGVSEDQLFWVTVEDHVGGWKSANTNTLPFKTDCVGGFNAINPSFNYIPDTGKTRLAVAMRALCLGKDGDQAIWHSQVLLGSMDAVNIRQPVRTNITWNSKQLTADPRSANLSKEVIECQIPRLDTADGPEDPRLVLTPSGGLFLVVAGYAVVPVHEEEEERPVCGKTGFYLYASKVLSLHPPTYGPAAKLQFPGMGRVEKNWAMFTADDTTGSTVHAIYSVYPHKIGTLDLNVGDVEFQYETYSGLVVQLANLLQLEPENFHGGAGIARIVTEESDYFLSIMHTSVMNNDKTEYWNFPYKFQAHPPFNITRIGHKMPLTMKENPIYGSEMVAFVTTLLYDQGDVFIGYGAGDREARTLRMSLQEFDQQFFNATNSIAGAQGGSAQKPFDTDMLTFQKQPKCHNPVHKNVCQDGLTTSICRACL